MRSKFPHIVRIHTCRRTCTYGSYNILQQLATHFRGGRWRDVVTELVEGRHVRARPSQFRVRAQHLGDQLVGLNERKSLSNILYTTEANTVPYYILRMIISSFRILTDTGIYKY